MTIDKVAIYNDYLIVIDGRGAVSVIRFFDDSKSAKEEKDQIDVIHKDPNATSMVYAIYRNSRERLKYICDEMSPKFIYKKNWNTRTLGRKVIEHLKSKI